MPGIAYNFPMLKKHLPNFLTCSRVLLIPIFVILFYCPFFYAHFIAGLIFVIACLTDWFDGYLARRLQVTSPFGAFLDPVADKVLIATALVMIVAEGPKDLVIPAAIIIGREITISALREWMAELGKRASVAVNQIGKVKTALQMIALVMLIIRIPHVTDGWLWQLLHAEWFSVLGIVLLYLAAILTVWSMVVYCLAAWRVLKSA